MKQLYMLIFLVLSFISLHAQSEVTYNENNQAYSLILPKGWAAMEYPDYKVLEIYNGDQSVVYSIYELEATRLREAFDRAHSEAETEFIDHTLGIIIDEEINGILFHKISGTGLTEEDESFDIEVRLFKPTGDNFYMIYYSGLKEDLGYYQIELDAMNKSIRIP